MFVRNLKSRLRRLNVRRRKLLWVAAMGKVRDTTPVFIVGAQRSGTQMLSECLASSPEFSCLGEADPKAFLDFALRDDATIQRLTLECKYPFLVLRALKDSYRAIRLLRLHRNGKSIWAYRNYLDRTNSAVRMFGRHPLHVFDELSKGNREWQMWGMAEDIEQIVMSFDVAQLSEHEGAALMWWVRNSLFFSMALDANACVRLWSYDAFVREPDRELRRIMDFLGARYHSFMVTGLHAHLIGKEPHPPLRREIRDLCESLYQRLEGARLRA